MYMLMHVGAIVLRGCSGVLGCAGDVFSRVAGGVVLRCASWLVSRCAGRVVSRGTGWLVELWLRGNVEGCRRRVQACRRCGGRCADGVSRGAGKYNTVMYILIYILCTCTPMLATLWWGCCRGVPAGWFGGLAGGWCRVVP